MSGASFGLEHSGLSKAEKVAWLQFGLLLVAAAYMGWLWWSSWPDTEVLRRHAAVFDPWRNWLLIFAVAGVWIIKLRGPKEPLADERDRAINGEARTNGFAALALMVLLLCVAVRSEGLLQDHLTADWLTLALVSILVLAFLVDAGYRLVRYRWLG